MILVTCEHDILNVKPIFRTKTNPKSKNFPRWPFNVRNKTDFHLKKIASRFVGFFTCVLEKLNKLAAKSTKINENTFYNVQPLLR